MPGDAVATLMLGGDELGRVESIELDEWVGWFRGRWAPTPRFEEVKDLFDAERNEWLGRYEAARWRAVWEEIWSRGVTLVLDGSQYERDFALEIENEEKTWLTYWGSHLDRTPPRASVGPATRKDLIPVNDPAWRRAVEAALEREGELVCLTMRDAVRRWFLVQTQGELARVLASVASVCPWGKSDGISVLGTPEFPHRGHDIELLRAQAKKIATASWAIVGCARGDDPELHYAEGFDDPDEVDEWFSKRRGGMVVVGEDPFCRERVAYPDGDEELFAYGVRADGTVLPGSF